MSAPRTRKRRRGRPTKYTPEVGARIVAAIQVGAQLETAAAAAGIAKDTLWRWMRDGARSTPRRGPPLVEPDPARPGKTRPILRTLWDFSDAVKKAFDSVEIKMLQAIGGADDWKAKAWILERRHPERYARPAQRHIHEGGTTNTNVNVNAAGAGGAPVDLSALSDDELDQLDTLTSRAIGRAQRSPRGRGTRSEPPGDGEEE
jgi:transposase-like protein